MSQNAKNKIMLYVFLAAIVGVFFLPITNWIKVALDGVLVLLFIYLRRAYILFVIGAKKLEKKDPKCWDFFKKAVNAHLPYTQCVYMCTAFIKQGDADYGIDLAEKIVKSIPDTREGKIAQVTLSMGYWVKGRIDEAIKLLEDLKAKGFEDKTLDINLTTYLLEKGDTARALELIQAAEKEGLLSHGMLDNKLWALILTGQFDKAEASVTELMDERRPKFPEAYLHSSQVMIHQGRIEKAVEYLNSALSQRFSFNGPMGQDYLKNMVDGLSDPKTRLAYAYAIDQNPVLVGRGKEFPVDLGKGKEFKMIEEAKVQKELKREADEKARERKAVIDDLDDDREPNTDLDDDDCLSSFLDDEDEDAVDDDDIIITEDDEKGPNTDVDADDERLPNTDVD